MSLHIKIQIALYAHPNTQEENGKEAAVAAWVEI